MNPPKDGQRGPYLLLEALGHILWLWIYVISVVVFPGRAVQVGKMASPGDGGTAADCPGRVTEVWLACRDRPGGVLRRISVALGALDLLRGPGEVIVIFVLCQRDVACSSVHLPQQTSISRLSLSLSANPSNHSAP